MHKIEKPVTLKQLAEHLGLSQTTVSIVLNNAPGANTIAPATRQRVRDAAESLHYHPNLHAHILGSRHRRIDLAGENLQFTSSEEDLTRRVRELEHENAKLKLLVAELCVNKRNADRH
jgi:DNA-binding LacI/PurR family transcriptional regulator